MQNLPTDKLLEIGTGFMAAKYLFAANELGVFETLAHNPAPLAELAQKLNLPPRTLRILVDALVALNLLEREGDLYRNSDLTATHLSGPPETGLRPLLYFWNKISYLKWFDLEKAIQTGQKTFDEYTPEDQTLVIAAMSSVTQQYAEALVEVYDFSPHRCVLDIGGGNGSFLIAILERYPHLKGQLFDLPRVVNHTEQNLAETSLAKKIEFFSGDALRDPVPVGADVILMANFLHVFSPQHIREVLKKIWRGAARGTRLLLVDFWTDPTHSDPVYAALVAGEFLHACGEGDVYSLVEITDWLTETGWECVDHLPLAGASSLVVAVYKH